MTADLSSAERAVVDRIGQAPDAPEALREKVAWALLMAVLGNTDGEIVLNGDLPASEVARLIVEHAADAAIEATRGAR